MSRQQQASVKTGESVRGPVERLGINSGLEAARCEHFTMLRYNMLKRRFLWQIRWFSRYSDDFVLAMFNPRYCIIGANPCLTGFFGPHGQKPYPPSWLRDDQKPLINFDVAQRRAGG